MNINVAALLAQLLVIAVAFVTIAPMKPFARDVFQRLMVRTSVRMILSHRLKLKWTSSERSKTCGGELGPKLHLDTFSECQITSAWCGPCSTAFPDRRRCVQLERQWKGKMRIGAALWHGPAPVIGLPHESLWLAHRTTTVKCVRSHVRHASSWTSTRHREMSLFRELKPPVFRYQ